MTVVKSLSCDHARRHGVLRDGYEEQGEVNAVVKPIRADWPYLHPPGAPAEYDGRKLRLEPYVSCVM